MKRAVILLGLLVALTAPAGASPTTSSLPRSAMKLAGDLRGVAADFPQEGRVAAQLASAAAMAGVDVRAERIPAASFADAMAALYRAAGATQRPVAEPSVAVARMAAPLVSAIARGIELTNDGLARLAPGERAWAARNLDLFQLPFTKPGERLASIASRVDVAKLYRAAVTIASAIDSLPADAPRLAQTWVDPNGIVEIGSTGTDVYATDRILTLDLGGDDQYYNSAGAIGAVPGNAFGVPVSVSVDLSGDDAYYAYQPNQADNTLVAQGVGIGGVGLLVDRWGNDFYGATLYGPYPVATCAPDPVFAGYPGRFPQIIHAQGVGALGVGGLVDLSGDDYEYAASYVLTSTQCHFVRNEVHAQAAGLQRGIGVLIDDTGNDTRYISSTATGYNPYSQDYVAGAYGQGFGAGGVGVLVDKEGNDNNIANSYASWDGQDPNKGSFATTFVQGAVAGLIQDYTPPNALAAPLAGIPVALPCAPASTSEHGGKQGIAGYCEFAGVGLHLDVLGTDTFSASAITNQSGGSNQCGVGSDALVGAQGAAAWGGVAGFANLDVAEFDQMTISPSAFGSCPGDSTRAIGVGQGFGGAVRYPIWDDPESYYASVDGYWFALPGSPNGGGGGLTNIRPAIPAIGVLASAGPACPPGQPTATTQPLEASVPCRPAFDALTSSNDQYLSYPYAYNPQNVGVAESWVQGSGGRPRPNSTGYPPLPLPASTGVGVHTDVGGDDVLTSAPYAYGGLGGSALSIAQGATQGGIGAAVNVFGDDQYNSSPVGNGSAQTLHQGDARAGFGEAFMPIAVFADAGGRDTYGPTLTCQSNGGISSAVIWGNFGTCGAQPGTLIVGLDAASGVGL